MKKYCVYKHVSPEGKIYIGITHFNPIDRWKGEYNNSFTRDIEKFKAQGKKFDHFVLNKNAEWIKWNSSLKFEDTNIFDETEAGRHERYWIETYNTNNREYGYNYMPGGTYGWETSYVFKKKISKKLRSHMVSEETRKKISVANKGKNPNKPRKVLQYNLNGDFLNAFYSIAFAANATGTSRSAICQAASGRSKSAGGFIWKYEEQVKDES